MPKILFNNVYRGKRVLVTGHTGFKGSWLSEWLIEMGAQVAGYSNNIPTNPSHFVLLNLQDRLKNFIGDVRDLAALNQAFDKFKPEIVFHLAAQSLVRHSYIDPKGTMDTNIGGTVNIFEAVRHTPSVKVLINVTSDKCYQNNEKNEPFVETDPMGGKDPYSASKGAAEIVFHSYYQSFFGTHDTPRLASVRAGNVIGGGDWAVDRVVPDCVRAWAKNEAVPIRNPRATRPWQHVLEPLSGYLLAGATLLEKTAAIHGEAFNFGPTPEAAKDVEALVNEMKKSWPEAIYKIESDSHEKKREAKTLRLSFEKAKKLIHWEPVLSFSESVAMTAEWYRDHYHGAGPTLALTSNQIRHYCDLAKKRGRTWV
ncbi:MAG: CDP-glucose 4,6-dehydratase [Bdellovibrionota bacterium]